MSVRKLQLINTGIQYWIGVLLSYCIDRCILFTLLEFFQKRQRIPTWYYYLLPDTIINSIKVGVRYFLKFHINQLINIWQVNIIILDIIINQTVLNGIGLSCIIDRLPVITNYRFKRLHKCMHPLFHL